MALINCPDCNQLISDKANACPNCGHPFFADKLSRNAKDLSTKASQGLLKARNYSKENKSKAIKLLSKISKLSFLLLVAVSSIIFLKHYYFLNQAEEMVVNTCESYIGKTITYRRPYGIYKYLHKFDNPEVTLTIPQDINWNEIKNRVSFDYDLDVPYVGALISMFATTPSGTRWECTPKIARGRSYFHPYRLEGIWELKSEK